MLFGPPFFRHKTFKPSERCYFFAQLVVLLFHHTEFGVLSTAEGLVLKTFIVKPRVALAFLGDQPGFIAPKNIGGKHYRVLRVRVTNTGGESLYNLRAQLRLSTSHYLYSNMDLTLKEEDLPIIQGRVIRRDERVLTKLRTSFGLERGEEQFVNIATQENVDGNWKGIELCLSHIGADNYSNQLNLTEPIEFSVIVLGGIYPPYSQSFVMFLDENGVLQLREP